MIIQFQQDPIRRNVTKRLSPQVSENVTLANFCRHISDHNSKYNRADIMAVLTQTVDCLREMLLGGKKIGHLGKVRYDVVEKLNIAEGKKADTNIFLAELDYSALSEFFKAEIKYQQPSAYLPVSRDLSVLVDMDVECGRIMKEIKAASEEISEVKLFDIYVSDKLGNNKKSMAFKIELASADSDVTDEMTDAVIEKVVNVLSEQFGAQMRG